MCTIVVIVHKNRTGKKKFEKKCLTITSLPLAVGFRRSGRLLKYCGKPHYPEYYTVLVHVTPDYFSVRATCFPAGNYCHCNSLLVILVLVKPLYRSTISLKWRPGRGLYNVSVVAMVIVCHPVCSYGASKLARAG